MGDMEIPDELIDQLLGEYQGPERLTGPDGLINQLRRRLIERAAGVELEQHLGYSSGGEPPEGQPNRRNGTTSKTLRTQDGPVAVELPRDREGSFEPRIVPKHGRSFDGLGDPRKRLRELQVGSPVKLELALAQPEGCQNLDSGLNLGFDTLQGTDVLSSGSPTALAASRVGF